MFSSKDLQSIDRSYFTVTQASKFAVTVQSNNTGHYWHIEPYEYAPGKLTCTIYHNHHRGYDFHVHGHGATLKICLEKIKSHDEYQLRKDASRMQRIKRHHEMVFYSKENMYK